MERKSTEGCGNRDLDSSGFDYKRFYLDVLAGYIYIYILDALRAFKSATSIRRPEDQTSAQIHCRLPDFGGCGPHFLAAEILYFAVPLFSQGAATAFGIAAVGQASGNGIHNKICS